MCSLFPRLIATSIRLNARKYRYQEKNREPLLDFVGSPCKGLEAKKTLALVLASGVGRALPEVVHFIPKNQAYPIARMAQVVQHAS